MFFLAETIWGIAMSLYSGANEAMIYDSLKKINEEKLSKKIFGRCQSMNLVAMVIASFAGGFIAKYLGLEWPMRLMAIPLTLAFFVCLIMKEPKAEEKKESLSYIEILRDGVKYFYKHPILKILAFSEIPISLFVFYIIWIYQIILKDINFNIAYFNIVHAGLTIVQIILLNTYHKWDRIIGKKNYLLASALIPGIAFIVLGFSFSPWLVIPLILVISMFGLTRKTVFAAYYNKHIESHHRSTVLSTISMTKKFIAAFVYPLIGIAVDWKPRITLTGIGIALLVFGIMSRIEEDMLLD